MARPETAQKAKSTAPRAPAHALQTTLSASVTLEGVGVHSGKPARIVLHPADDYIASFVRDVNRGRVIRCRTLMRAGPPVEGPSVDAGLVIEEAARLLSAEGRDVANVVNGKGRVLGTVSMGDIIGAMVPPREEGPVSLPAAA